MSAREWLVLLLFGLALGVVGALLVDGWWLT